MKLYAEVQIKIVEKREFTGANGEPVEYYVNYLKDENQSVLEVSSGRLNLSEHEGQEGLAEFRAQETREKGLKLTLVGFRVGEELGVETEID